MNSVWIMPSGEISKWSSRLDGGDWPFVAWESLMFGIGFIALYILLLYLAIAGLSPALRTPFLRMKICLTPIHSIIFFNASLDSR